MFELREYQQRDIDRIRAEFSKGNVLYQAPCGSGKTVLFAHVARKVQSQAHRGARALILVHRRELLTQTSEKLREMEVPHGLIMSGYPAWPEAPIQLASVQTATRRLNSIGKFNLVICDEAHHILADSYSRLIDGLQPTPRVLGLTATPLRLDSRGLGRVAGGPFDSLVVGPSIKELVRDGYLSPVEVYAPASNLDLSNIKITMGDYNAADLEKAVDKPVITGNAIVHYQRICPGERAMVFCISVKHAHDVAKLFNDNGIPAEGIDGTMEDRERRAILDRFESGATRIMTSCELVGEGLDVPAVGAVISLRPTKSLNLYIQQVGRAQRVAPGKTKAVLLDHVGNVRSFGLPDADRTWTLEGRPRGTKDSAPVPNLRCCEGCFFVFDSFEPACPKCGLVPEKRLRTIYERPGELVKVGTDSPYYTSPAVALDGMSQIDAALNSVAETWQTRERKRLEKIAQQKGYRPGWVTHVLERQMSAMRKKAAR